MELFVSFFVLFLLKIVCIFRMGVIHWDDGCCFEKGYRITGVWALLHAGPGQAPMWGCILKIQVRFYVSSTQTLEERREWVSCRANTGQNGENEILTMNQSEQNWRTVTLQNPHLIMESGGLLLLRNTFYCCQWDAWLEQSASLLHEQM